MRPPKHPPGYRNMMESQMYNVKTVCKNCSNMQGVEIPKGTTVEQYIKGVRCNDCGCAELKVTK